MDRRRLSLRALADARRVRCRRRRAGHLPSRVPLVAHVPAGKRLPSLALHDLPERVPAVARASAAHGRARRHAKSTSSPPTHRSYGVGRDGFDDASSRLDLGPAIDVALAKIPEPFRSTLIIVDVEDQSYEAAAETLGVPIGTVRSRLFRGRRLMQEQLQTVRDGRVWAHRPMTSANPCVACADSVVASASRPAVGCGPPALAVQREPGLGDDVRRERAATEQ